MQSMEKLRKEEKVNADRAWRNRERKKKKTEKKKQ
jgi:hypothetical protein